MTPTATPTSDGDAYDLNATAVLLVLASNAYGEASHDTPPTGQARAAKVVADLLAAAGAGGYPLANILETLLTNGETGPRVTAMCSEAMDAAGSERIGAVFAAMRQSLRD
jgi:hypothetical protein